MKNTLKISIAIILAASVFVPCAYSVEAIYEERDRLIRLETKIDTGFQQMDKRFEDLRGDMNKRFEELRDDTNKRFEQVISFLWMLTGIFTTLTVGVIGFAYWDRRTIIKKAKDETIAEIEGEGRVKDMINALRELSKSNGEVAKVPRQFHIL